jgi:hypothetical protein
LHANFDDHWCGGWDDIFPNGVACENRNGDGLPYMGELWSQSCSWAVIEASVKRLELRTTVLTPITPARWERRVIVESGSPSVRIRYHLENVGLAAFDYNLGIHPSQPVTAAHRIDLPARRGEVDDAGGMKLGRAGDEYEWPTLAGTDVGRCMPPSAGCFALHYLTGLTDGWVALTDTSRKVGLGLVFDPNVFSAVWLWMNYGGWRGYYHVLVEPWTGFPSSLTRAIEAGHARSLGPGEVLETDVSAVIYRGVQSVSNLTAEGAVCG